LDAVAITGLRVTQLIVIFIFENLPTFSSKPKMFFDLLDKRFVSNRNALGPLALAS